MLQSGLGQLVIDELLYQRGRPPRSRYLFKHALIQDAAYQSLLKRTREASHARPASTSIGASSASVGSDRDRRRA
jgi:predicted ATPase